MIALAIVGVLGATLALTWHRPGGALLPLGLAIAALCPLALVGWLSAEVSRRWLARPARVRRTLATLGLDDWTRDATLAARRIGKGRMNAVIDVTIVRTGDAPRRLVLKHLLWFGTLLGWVARHLGATREYPEEAGRVARTRREVRALLQLGREGLPVPRLLGCSLRHHVVAMTFIEGEELAPALVREPRLVEELGALLARLHGAGLSTGDANPENMAVDRRGKIVLFDLEQSHFGAATDWRKRGFDLAWAAAFLATDLDRARFYAAYGARPAPLDAAIADANRHLRRFSPLVEWYGQRWRRAAPTLRPVNA